MSARNLPLALVFLALGFALGCLFTTSGGREAPKNGERVALEAIDARLARIELALDHARIAETTPAAPPSEGGTALIGSAASSAPERHPVETATDQPPVADELIALRKAVETLRRTEPGRAVAARFPTLGMIRGAPEPNAQALEHLHAQLCAGGATYAAAQESLHWKSQEEILATYGRPTQIQGNGEWFYELAGENRSLIFQFVEDYITFVNEGGC